MVLTLGSREDRLKNVRDKWVLCPICGASSGIFVIKGISDDRLVCETCQSEWVIQFSYGTDEPWLAKLKRGFAKLEEGRRKEVEGLWLAMEGWITPKMKDYERSQLSKGLVRHEGEWVTVEERIKREFERKQRVEESTEEWFKRIQEFERRERERLKGLAIKFELIECPRCTNRYSSKWPVCPFCRAREIREAGDRSRLH